MTFASGRVEMGKSMGWFSRLFGGGAERAVEKPPATQSLSTPPHFVVIDVETTGLSPKADRVLELAMVRVDQRGNVVDEWSTRFNPEGPVGATHIHGITQRDVERAPLFRDLAASIVPQIAGLPIAAHNARFDLSFLRAEFRRAGWDVPWLPAYCTLEGSRHYMPHLDRRRLVDCCWDARVPLNDAHSALGDARATAGLLRYYLQSHRRTTPHDALTSVQRQAPTVVWPSGASRSPLTVLPDETTPRRSTPPRTRSTKPAQPALVEQLATLSLEDILDEGAPEGSLAYLETLLNALEDGAISEAEASALGDLIDVYELTDADVAVAHRSLAVAVAHKALDDGHVSREERAELDAVAHSLGLPSELVPALIAEADAARAARITERLRPLPADWTSGEPLRVGDKVAFTGFDGREHERLRLEKKSQELGVRVMGNVSGRTAMVVTDGSFPGTKLARAHDLGTRVVAPELYALLLRHLQPAQAPVPKKPEKTMAVAPAGEPSPVRSGASPSDIRAWGLANGFAVSVRGRLSAELIRAYERAARADQLDHGGH